jgi:transposase-like protein
MAKLDQLIAKAPVRVNRYFSEDFKRKKVDELDKCLTSMAEICREYDVSRAAVYKWIYNYSVMKKKGIKMVIEPKSDTAKIQALKDHIAQLEQQLGQKQFENDFLRKQMEIASTKYGVDFKKKHGGKPLSGTGETGKNTTTK